MTAFLHLPKWVLLLAALAMIACGRHGPKSVAHGDEGWIGVYAQDLDDEILRYLDLDQRGGVLVDEVVGDGPAQQAGLREEDVITRFDGKRIRRVRDLLRAVRRRTPGDKVRVEIVRNRQPRKLTLRVGGEPDHAARDDNDNHLERDEYAYSCKDNTGLWLGIEMTDLNDDLADYFEVSGRDGVLVLRVVENSPAHRGGLRAGDVIERFAGERIRDSEDLIEALAEQRDWAEVKLQVRRKGRRKNLIVKLAHADPGPRSSWDREDRRSLRGRLEEWQKKVEKWARHAEYRGRIDIDLPLEELGVELESGLEEFGEDLDQEMQELRKTLKDLDIKIKLRQNGTGI